jgi:hypothetical protein
MRSSQRPLGGSSLDGSVFSENGVATANLDNNGMGAQNGGGSRGTGTFYNLYGNTHPTSWLRANFGTNFGNGALSAYVKKFLVGGGTDDTTLLRRDQATADVARWKQWATPTLE